jgi:hypothetical protein
LAIILSFNYLQYIIVKRKSANIRISGISRESVMYMLINNITRQKSQTLLNLGNCIRTCIPALKKVMRRCTRVSTLKLR